MIVGSFSIYLKLASLQFIEKICVKEKQNSRDIIFIGDLMYQLHKLETRVIQIPMYSHVMISGD